MCGFAGIYLSAGNIDQELLMSMTASIRHRGPDDEGYLVLNTFTGKYQHCHGADSSPDLKQCHPSCPSSFTGNLGFGFRRLSILDQGSTGHQPMSDIRGELHIVFNGEIYNYLELANELRAMGYQFRGHSDTEVILAAYQAWGQACVQRFVGMWAFAIWDQSLQILFCSRDRFGIKPFYYAHLDNDFWFGSELKQLRYCPADQELNLGMIYRSMKINAMLAYEDETYWQNYKALAPGHNLILRKDQLLIERYYSLDPLQFETFQGSFEDAVSMYRELFFNSVGLQMRADVEVGSCLSGGLDSSSIVCHAASLTDRQFQTFSSYYADDASLDERKWIALVAKSANAASHLVSPSVEDTESWLTEATHYNDLPVGAGLISQSAVMQKAREHGIKVLLDGQGSDELTAGYKHANYRYFADQIRSLELNTLIKELPLFLKHKSLPARFSALGKIGLTSILKESQLYQLEFAHYRFDPFDPLFQELAKPQDSGANLACIKDLPTSRLSNFLYNMTRVTSLQTLLHYEDRMSMAHGVESRVPFLDHRLVEFAFSLPSRFKIKHPYQKYIHRISMKEVVPAEIYERTDKAIFSAPFYSRWMRAELVPYIESIFSSNQFRTRGIYNLPQIMNKWHQYKKGKQGPAEMLFNVLALEVWFRVHVDDQYD